MSFPRYSRVWGLILRMCWRLQVPNGIFFPSSRGLVGGHCIGVDPYYLAQCAQSYGYNPEIILAGRRMNDGMGEYVAGQVIKLMLKKRNSGFEL